MTVSVAAGLMGLLAVLARGHPAAFTLAAFFVALGVGLFLAGAEQVVRALLGRNFPGGLG